MNRWWRNLPDVALDLCAENAGVNKTHVRPLWRQTQRSSRLFYVGTRGGADEPEYVVKTPRDDWRAAKWDPASEFSALESLAHHAPPGKWFGVVTPIAFGTEPKFLITRYRSARPLTHAFLESASILSGYAACRRSIAGARRAGQWLAALHVHNTQVGGGVTVEQYLGSCSERISDIHRYLRPNDDLSNVLVTAERCVKELNDDDRRMLANAHLCHGDFVPDNILMDNSGVLYPFDPEGFGYFPLQRDLCRFKLWMLKLVIRFPPRRRHMERLWQTLWTGYTTAGVSEGVAALGYLHYVLGRVSWHRHPERERGSFSPRRVLAQLDDCMWVRNWVKWLKGVHGGLRELSRLAREVL